jgi:hypothetical protein
LNWGPLRWSSQAARCRSWTTLFRPSMHSRPTRTERNFPARHRSDRWSVKLHRVRKHPIPLYASMSKVAELRLLNSMRREWQYREYLRAWIRCRRFLCRAFTQDPMWWSKVVMWY